MTVDFFVSDEHVELSFRLGKTSISPEAWAAGGPLASHAALNALRRCEARDQAVIDQSGVLLNHEGVASLSPAEAHALGLPPATTAVLSLSQRGILPNAEIAAAWVHPGGSPILAPVRRGAFLQVGGQEVRLPQPLFGIVTALEAFQHAPKDDPDERMRRLIVLKALLPGKPDRNLTASGMLLSMRIAYAEAFTLDAVGNTSDPRPIPLLQRRPGEDQSKEGSEPAPLLEEPYQSRFSNSTFLASAKARPAYSLGDRWYLALSRPLQGALQVVREMYDAPLQQRRAFLRNPRPWLKDRLGADYEETVVESLFHETSAYSERVIGLGLWQPRVLPWIKRPSEDWFGPAEYGIDISGRRISIPADSIETLPERIRAAIEVGAPFVHVPEPDGPPIPATRETQDAVETLRREQASGKAQPTAAQSGDAERPKAEPHVLLIAANEERAEYARGFAQREPQLALDVPACVRTALKEHQSSGLDWLRRSWNAGRPGVLLADEMGLGKTLQCLAFLALLRDRVEKSGAPRRPFLVVAPVGLLANWLAEHDRHLSSPGLGTVCQAFGPHLARMRTAAERGCSRSRLNTAELAAPDWVLTTYETLRDNQTDFGQVSFSVVVFDEAQRIKTPAARVTDAAKGLKADFTIALTGTPVENRLADLWCIVDTLQPGYLGELKSFSARYEQRVDEQALLQLKGELERSTEATPRLMMRRLKNQHLPGLPDKRQIPAETPMPSRQAESYRAALDAARASTGQGDRLSALQALRAISLHPEPDLEVDDEAFLAASARLSACRDILDRIAEKGEKALVFLDLLALQARLADILQRRYRMARAPMIISGEVAGLKRQERVDAFQAGPPGFDVMLLSTRAAGVGLTMTAARHVIHLSRWWNPAVEDQCTDRVHRLGQTCSVEVHLPIALFPADPDRSFDRTLHALLERKRKMANGLLAAPVPTRADEDELFRATVGP